MMGERGEGKILYRGNRTFNPGFCLVMEVGHFLCVYIELGRTALGIVTKVQCRYDLGRRLGTLELDSDGSPSRIE